MSICNYLKDKRTVLSFLFSFFLFLSAWWKSYINGESGITTIIYIHAQTFVYPRANLTVDQNDVPISRGARDQTKKKTGRRVCVWI